MCTDPRAAGEASRWEDHVGNTRCNQTRVLGSWEEVLLRVPRVLAVDTGRRLERLRGVCPPAYLDKAPVPGTPPWAAPSSRRPRAAPTRWAGDERCGLASISPSGLLFGR